MSIHLKSPRTQPKPDGLIDVPSHKGAAGAGAVIGGIAAGAAAGMAAGPVGAAIGAVAGAVAGGLGGDAVANSIDEVREAAHWRENFKAQPYVSADATYEDFGPAYAYGVAQYSRYPEGTFDEVQDEMADEWYAARGQSTLVWERASPAARDAWERLARERA